MAIIKTTSKIYGIYFILKGIGAIIIGFLLVGAGIVLLIYSKDFKALILSLLGLIAIIGGMYLYKRGKAAKLGDAKRILY